MHGRGDHRFFDAVARLYDAAMPPADAGALGRGLALAERPLERLLDVAGGTGRAAVAVDADRRVVVDRSAGMLARARERPGVKAVRGDAERLPVRDASVDAVTVVDALHHVPDRGAALREAARVLAPGGVLVVREFDPTTLRGRALVGAERLAGFDSAFVAPDDLAAAVDAVGLSATVVERGFGYTVAGVAPGAKRESH
jgi:demethylmenaquinone methyltransferase/2-methoxy-6-polyprenyl-1,4-benzoquinol methylase